MKKAGLVAVILLILLAAGIILSSYIKPELTGEITSESEGVIYDYDYEPEITPGVCGNPLGLWNTFDYGAELCNVQFHKTQLEFRGHCITWCLKACKSLSEQRVRRFPWILGTRARGGYEKCISDHCIHTDSEGKELPPEKLGGWISECLDYISALELSTYYFQHTAGPVKLTTPLSTITGKVSYEQSEYGPPPGEESPHGPDEEPSGYGVPEGGESSPPAGEEINPWKTADFAYYTFQCAGIGLCGCQDLDKDGYCDCDITQKEFLSDWIDKSYCKKNVPLWYTEEQKNQFTASAGDCNDDPVGNLDDCWNAGGIIPIPEQERTLKKYREEDIQKYIDCNDDKYMWCAKCGRFFDNFFIDRDGDGWADEESFIKKWGPSGDSYLGFCYDPYKPPEKYMPYPKFYENSIKKLMERNMEREDAEFWFVHWVLQKPDCSDDPSEDEHAAQRSPANKEDCNGIDEDCGCPPRVPQEYCADRVEIKGEGIILPIAKIDDLSVGTGIVPFICIDEQWVEATQTQKAEGAYYLINGVEYKQTSYGVFTIYGLYSGDKRIAWGANWHLIDLVTAGFLPISIRTGTVIKGWYPIQIHMTGDTWKAIKSLEYSYKTGHVGISITTSTFIDFGVEVRPFFTLNEVYWLLNKVGIGPYTGGAIMSSSSNEGTFEGKIDIKKITYEYPEPEYLGPEEPYDQYGPGEEPYGPYYNELPPIITKEEYWTEPKYYDSENKWTPEIAMNEILKEAMKAGNFTFEINKTKY